MKGSSSKKTLLGVGITSATQREVLQYIITSLEEQHDPYYIVTPNPEIIVLANKRREFLDILNQARIALPDGSGVTLAAQFLGKPLSQRITGVDLMESLCKEVSTPLRASFAEVATKAKKGFGGQGNPITVGFLGGRNGVAQKAADCLVRKYPGLKVSFIGEEWSDGLAGPAASSPQSARSIDILFVAFGFPK
ncbi:MAG: WecB/TagA/CpsF family glycosyltransferase, partial [Candidatus Levybacteria bacterium]|nr:WecB/TagA/CpsF family glycosyltransferase [Candidatus Levybacteria bacterium]